MKNFIVICWELVMDNRYHPLRHVDLASQHYLMQVLGWMWSMVFSLSFLSIFHFGAVWLAHVLLIAGCALTVAVFRESEQQQREMATSCTDFSHASACVWKLDSEA